MIRKPESEHSPLSGWDEYPIHQTPAPLRVVATTDARAYERYWFTAQADDAEFVLMAGIGFYPNLGTVDAYVAVNANHRHTTVRAHRYLNDTRHEIVCGPFTFEPIEPFREWRLRLADNEHQLSYDLTWRDTKRAVFQLASHPGLLSGRMPTRTAGYESFGRVSGTITLDGRTFTLDPDTTSGTRDHHWGERNGVGGLGHLEPQGRWSHFGQWVEFRDWSIWAHRILLPLGDERPGTLIASKMEYELEFDPETDHFVGGTVTNHLDNGETKVVAYEQIDDKVIYLRTGMYMGPDLVGTPDQNYFHGMDVGDNVTSRDDYDVTDPKTRIRIAGWDNHLVRATCDGESTIGLVEVRNPVIYEWARDGVRGFTLKR